MMLRLLDHHHSRLHSPVHRLPASVKLAVALGILLAIVLMPPPAWISLAALASLLAVGILLSRIPPLFLGKRLLVLSPFVLGMVLVQLVQPVGGVGWATTTCKSLLCLLTVLLVSQTTPFSDVLRVLRHLRVPPLLITTLALMHRYLFVLADEAGRMSRARASRTFQRRRRAPWHTLSTVIGQLFVRASERAERIYAAMCARGWR